MRKLDCNRLAQESGISQWEQWKVKPHVAWQGGLCGGSAWLVFHRYKLHARLDERVVAAPSGWTRGRQLGRLGATFSRRMARGSTGQTLLGHKAKACHCPVEHTAHFTAIEDSRIITGYATQASLVQRSREARNQCRRRNSWAAVPSPGPETGAFFSVSR
jgi:hypothetical protein